MAQTLDMIRRPVMRWMAKADDISGNVSTGARTAMYLTSRTLIELFTRTRGGRPGRKATPSASDRPCTAVVGLVMLKMG